MCLKKGANVTTWKYKMQSVSLECIWSIANHFHVSSHTVALEILLSFCCCCRWVKTLINLTSPTGISCLKIQRQIGNNHEKGLLFIKISSLLRSLTNYQFLVVVLSPQKCWNCLWTNPQAHETLSQKTRHRNRNVHQMSVCRWRFPQHARSFSKHNTMQVKL